MSVSLGGGSKYQLDNDKSQAQQGMVSTRSIGKKAKFGEQMDQGERGLTVKIPVECYSRVVGYLRPVSAWNPGKEEEWKDRVPYRLEQTDKSEDGGDEHE